MSQSPVSVSVCLPSLNGEKHLNSAIESVLSQSFEDFELIIVDDCSDDSSFEIASKYARQDRRVKAFKNNSRSGLFANYNVCLNQSKGEFIKPFAQDDVLSPFYLDVAVGTLRKDPEISLFAASREWIDDDGRDVSKKHSSPFVSEYFSMPGPVDGDSVIEKSLETLVNFIGEPVCVTYRRTDPDICFDEEFHHLGDLDMWLRLLRSGKLAFTSQNLCKFRRHDGSQTNKNLESFAVAPDMMRLYRKLSAYTDKHDQFAGQILDNSVRMISDHFKFIASKNCDADSEVLKQLSRSDLELISAHALSLIGERQQFDRETDRLSVETIRLEKKLRRYLDDPFWRATRALREAKKYFHQKRDLDFERLEVGFDQVDYINLLKRKIVCVKLSRTFYLKRFIERGFKLDFSKSSSKASIAAKLNRLKSKSGIKNSTNVSFDSLDNLIKCELVRRKGDLPSPKVSVLIGFMRHSPINALNALKVQSLLDDSFEVVCVDSSGSDEIANALKEWSEQNKSVNNFTIVVTRKAGRAFANNVALRMAKASIVVLLASDFVPEQDFVQRHLQFHDSKSVDDLVAIGGAVFNNGGSRSGFQQWLDESGVVFGVPFVRQSNVPADFFYAANTSLRKELIFQAGLFDEDFKLDAWDDYEIGLRLTNIGAQSVYLNDVTCKHEHRVTFLERLKLMKHSADAALTFDLKVPGNYPWHKELEKPTSGFAMSALVNYKNHLLTGDPAYLHRCWEQSLRLAFLRSYKNCLNKEWIQQLKHGKLYSK